MKARFVAAARREFLAEVDYYNQQKPKLGLRFIAAVEEAVLRALAFPLTGSSGVMETRRVFVKDFPFSVIYRSGSRGITVFAVSHHSRLPNYWLSRVGKIEP